MIPAGRSSGTFTIYVADDIVVNPRPYRVPLSARTAPWPGAIACQALVDNEVRWLTVEAPAEIIEGTPAQGVIKLRAARTLPFVVQIGSPDPSHRERLGLPIEVLVPAGVTEQVFTLDSAGSTYRADLPDRLELLALPDTAWLAPGTDVIQFVQGVWEGEVTIHGEALGVPLHVTAADLGAEGPPLDILRGREHRDEYVLTECASCTPGPDGALVLGGLSPGQSLVFTARFRALLPGLDVLSIYGNVERDDDHVLNDYVGTAFVAAPEAPTADDPSLRLPSSGRFAWDPQSRLILATFEGVLSGLVTLEPATLALVHQVVLSGYVSILAACGDGLHAWLFVNSGFTRVNYQTGTADLHFTPDLSNGLWQMASPPSQPDLLVLITADAFDGWVRVYDRETPLPVSYGPMHFSARFLGNGQPASVPLGEPNQAEGYFRVVAP